MASVTYFAVLPFVRNDDGELCPVEAVECASATVAAFRSQAIGAERAGAVAFSRTGNPDTGERADAVILARVGETPVDLEAATGT